MDSAESAGWPAVESALSSVAECDWVAVFVLYAWPEHPLCRSAFQVGPPVVRPRIEQGGLGERVGGHRELRKDASGRANQLF